MTKTRYKELRSAKRIISKFCKANDIKTPKCLIKQLDKSYGIFHTKKPKSIYIDLNKCKLSSKRRNATFIKDKTITGVAIHELAHYIHLGSHKTHLNAQFKRIKEPVIHFFENDIEEDIAESLRLFILNPTLLKDGRPKRYKILSKLFVQIKSKHYTELFFDLPNEDKIFIDNWVKGYC